LPSVPIVCMPTSEAEAIQAGHRLVWSRSPLRRQSGSGPGKKLALSSLIREGYWAPSRRPSSNELTAIGH
jgi:hypothetical protein